MEIHNPPVTIVFPQVSFSDERGHITNLLPSPHGPIGEVSIIYSKAGSVRSNHYHKVDSHWLYVLSGEIHYQECPAINDGPPNYEDEPSIIGAGEMVFTGPRFWHRVYFPVDTVLISMSARPRDHESHEADVVRAPES